MNLHRRITSEWSRLRHRRGHGVHSPLVYSLVREVFMKRHPDGGELYEALRGQGVRRKYAREIDGLHRYLGATGFSLEEGALRLSGPTPCVLRLGRHSALPGDALTIDRRGYRLTFDDPSLPKQHFIL